MRNLFRDNSLVLGMVLGIILVGIGMSGNTFLYRVISTILGLTFGAGIFLAINGYFLATRGQTVGKMVVNTKIVSEEGAMVPFAPLIIKRYLPIWVVGSIPWIGGVLALVNVLMIFRENRKCFHDDIAGTKVIQLNR